MRKFKLYTDGSHFKPSDLKFPKESLDQIDKEDEINYNTFKRNMSYGRLGIGGILVNSGGSVVDSLSMEVDRETLRSLYNTSDVSNPTMEMYAILMALRRFSRHLAFGDEVEVLSDYQGVMYWMTGKWRINKEYILMIKNDIETEAKNQKLNMTYQWIKGHNGDVYNELADKLAKGEILKV